MYERNAIVLERYFNKIFHFNDESNLRQNYYNYRKLFECYGILCDAKEKEKNSQEDFEKISKEISKIQKTQEQLYDKGAKYEYSRSIIFGNIEEETDKIEKHLNKVAEDAQKNTDELRELGNKFVESVIDYNEKNAILQDAISQREKAQSDYDEIYSKSKKCYEDITEDALNEYREFLNSENKDLKKDLQNTFEENGKNEKNQFDLDVISNTINKSVEIYKKEIEVYLFGIDRVSKLFEEIETDSVKTDKHNKYYRDSEAKIKFLDSEKDYVIQFLDNERIGAIYDKKTHRKLMLESCKKFVLDFEQIDKLYEIILKEIAGRSTKKIYKENYNKQYLFELENASIEPSLDTGKMRQEAIAFMNLNYWRASGMASVYETFEEIATTIYNKDLTEFLPKLEEPEVEEEPKAIEESKATEEPKEENIETIVENQEIVKEEVQENITEVTPQETEEIAQVEEVKEEKKAPKRLYYSSKKQLAKAIFYSLQQYDFAGTANAKLPKAEEVKEEASDEEYSVPENVEAILANIEKEEQLKEAEKAKAQEIEEIEKIENDESFVYSEADDVEYEADDITAEEVERLNAKEEYEEDEDEDSILEIYFNDNKEDEVKEESSIKEKAQQFTRKVGLLQRLARLNAKKNDEEV